MRIIENKIINVEDVVVGSYLIRPIEDIKNNEDLQNLASSIETMGQLHPCFVRINPDNKDELVAGGRRYTAMRYSNRVTMEVKVIEATNLECMELALTENIHRKNSGTILEHKQIYDTWKEGLKEFEYKQEEDLANKISWSVSKIIDIVIAGKFKGLYKDNVVVQNASTMEIVATKILEPYPEARIEILAKIQKRSILMKDVAKICDSIKKSLDTGAREEQITKAIKDDVSKSISEPATLTAEKLNDTLNVLSTAPKDVVEKLVEGKISVESAKAAKDFETEAARAQIIEEVKKKEEKKNLQQEVTQKLYEDGVKKHVEDRKIQEQEVKINGETSLKTKIDQEKQRLLDEEINRDKIHDQKFIDRYQRLFTYTVESLSHFSPRLLRTEDGKKYGANTMKALYGLYRKVLVESGELKEVRMEDEKENEKGNDNSIKYLNAINVEATEKP